LERVAAAPQVGSALQSLGTTLMLTAAEWERLGWTTRNNAVA
jgi:hypothetical protein